LTEVRSPQRQLVPDTDGPDEHEPTSLRGIALRALIGFTGQPVAKASTAEEPDAGKLHVRVWAGGAGQPAFLLRDVSPGESGVKSRNG